VAWWLLYWTTEEAYKQQMIELSEQKRFDLNGFYEHLKVRGATGEEDGFGLVEGGDTNSILRCWLWTGRKTLRRAARAAGDP
jgi:hypothetical protein